MVTYKKLSSIKKLSHTWKHIRFIFERLLECHPVHLLQYQKNTLSAGRAEKSNLPRSRVGWGGGGGFWLGDSLWGKGQKPAKVAAISNALVTGEDCPGNRNWRSRSWRDISRDYQCTIECLRCPMSLASPPRVQCRLDQGLSQLKWHSSCHTLVRRKPAPHVLLELEARAGL